MTATTPTTSLGDAQTESSLGGTARAIAEQCVINGASDDDCENLPIFSPGSDILEATANDLAGLAKNPGWVQLKYADREDRVGPGWYSNTAPCVPTTYNLDPARPEHCDEFPFRSTRQGGPGAQLAVISAADNQMEGQYLRRFYGSSGCNVRVPTEKNPDRAFLVLPTPTVHTSMWCSKAGD